MPTWHRGPVCLIGDAATPPRRTWGRVPRPRWKTRWRWPAASRDLPDVEQAFAAFEALRRERVEKIVAMARRNGQQKAITNPVGAFIRDLMLPLFIKLGGSPDWIYGYRPELGWTSRASRARSRERRDVVCPACLSLLGCRVCFALYASTPLAEDRCPHGRVPATLT